MIPDYIKVPVTAFIPIAMSIVRANEYVILFSTVLSVVYGVYKILEVREKRKYYKRLNSEKDASQPTKSERDKT